MSFPAHRRIRSAHDQETALMQEMMKVCLAPEQRARYQVIAHQVSATRIYAALGEVLGQHGPISERASKFFAVLARMPASKQRRSTGLRRTAPLQRSSPPVRRTPLRARKAWARAR